MGINEMMEQIRETNLNYILLAQQMLRDDKDAAMFRLGINKELADILESLTPNQVLKMAGLNMLLCRFRLDDSVILSMLSGYSKDKGGVSKDKTMAQSHAAILMAAQPAVGVV